ncbi:hypothetical protein LEP1GSC034_1412 [Leptospira interrogans str. 2003000735]|uniref:Uncharacterized protein n=4 Tax=Leptospira interrogans TaxID=173 RepID=A0AAQ0B0D1_LEPIR|nr:MULTISPECIES: hypothetical protein [Leptospira]EMM97677.1 hypothetical protein LEP1GSC158_3445 [Leptospira interrogans serovar Zanoni str. LT2156]EMY24238.1 hypothetical protein LEP1GSC115_1937 [Leptospira interrogans serovar Australis str. 200703203]AJR16645.1 hypothetical protein LIL_40035 [Leptospira interrogans serovar Linhai str. 56609]EKN89799.1 hypothetical protein LEP1GSC027_2086 [Leptospira interrogans str. 2002000624]EKO96682.1 hypothetical protein LEP1GSC057_4590 [Leptospira inte
MKRSDKFKMKKIKKKISKRISPKKSIQKKKSFSKQSSTKNDLDQIVKFVSLKRLKPNIKNDFDLLSKEEYQNLKQNMIANGILDPLT